MYNGNNQPEKNKTNKNKPQQLTVIRHMVINVERSCLVTYTIYFNDIYFNNAGETCEVLVILAKSLAGAVESLTSTLTLAVSNS